MYTKFVNERERYFNIAMQAMPKIKDERVHPKVRANYAKVLARAQKRMMDLLGA